MAEVTQIPILPTPWLTKVILDDVGALVLDIGTHTTKVGFAGADTPCVSRHFGL